MEMRKDMQEEILASAIGHIKEYGLRSLTMDDIARDLRVSKKTIYQHFSSKKELIRAVLAQAAAMEKSITEGALVRTEDWFAKIDAVLSVHSYTNIPYRLMDEIARYFPEARADVKAISEHKVKVLREVLQQGLKEGKLRQDLDLEIIILALSKVFLTPTDESFLLENDLTVNQLLTSLKDLFFYGSLHDNREGKLSLENTGNN